MERSFATVRAKALALMEAANITETMRNILWAEATNTATYLSNITPHSSNINHTSADELFYGKPPTAFEHLVPFGKPPYQEKQARIVGRKEKKDLHSLL